MTTLRNSARDKLTAGELAIGFSVRMLRTAEAGPMAAAAGYDWLWLDCEHGVLSLDQAAQMAIGALGAGIAPIVRVPNGEYSLATRILDNGALGIVIPHVDTADEAREIVPKRSPLSPASMSCSSAPTIFVRKWASRASSPTTAWAKPTKP